MVPVIIQIIRRVVVLDDVDICGHVNNRLVVHIMMVVCERGLVFVVYSLWT